MVSHQQMGIFVVCHSFPDVWFPQIEDVRVVPTAASTGHGITSCLRMVQQEASGRIGAPLTLCCV